MNIIWCIVSSFSSFLCAFRFLCCCLCFSRNSSSLSCFLMALCLLTACLLFSMHSSLLASCFFVRLVCTRFLRQKLFSWSSKDTWDYRSCRSSCAFSAVPSLAHIPDIAPFLYSSQPGPQCWGAHSWRFQLEEAGHQQIQGSHHTWAQSWVKYEHFFGKMATLKKIDTRSILRFF